MAASKSPSRADFHAALDTFGSQWFSAALRITGDRARAEDAVQDGLLRAWDQRRRFQGQAMLSSWIHRIIVNAALQSLRRQRGETDLGELEFADLEQGPAGRTEQQSLVMNTDHALAQLTELERTCFVLRHLQDWRIREIAAKLSHSENSIKQALFRGVRKLRDSDLLREALDR